MSDFRRCSTCGTVKTVKQFTASPYDRCRSCKRQAWRNRYRAERGLPAERSNIKPIPVKKDVRWLCDDCGDLLPENHPRTAIRKCSKCLWRICA